MVYHLRTCEKKIKNKKTRRKTFNTKKKKIHKKVEEARIEDIKVLKNPKEGLSPKIRLNDFIERNVSQLQSKALS